MKTILSIFFLTASCLAQWVASPGVLTTPTSAPGPGTYGSTQSVTLDYPANSYVCYTTDGSTPAGSTTGCTTGTHYTGAFDVAATSTVKAKAYKPYYLPSAVMSEDYTISGSGHPAVFTNVTHVWHMSEAANSTRSDSVGTSHLTDANSNTGVATGLLHANAVHYTGAADQNLTTSITVSSATAFTFATWFKPSNTTPNVRLFFDGAGNTAFFYNSGYFNVVDNTGNSGNLAVTLNTATWHQVVLVGYTGGSCNGGFTCFTLYLDGTSQGQVGYNNTYNGTFVIHQVGNYNQYYNYAYDVGDTFLWVGASLTSGDATTLWNGGAGLDY